MLNPKAGQLTFTCSKLTIKTLEQGVKYQHISRLVPVSVVNFVQVTTGWEVSLRNSSWMPS